MQSEMRNSWLMLADDKFARDCSFHAFRAGGPGGQKQNKTSSAVRLVHNPTGISAEAAESRSRNENLAKAIKKLKLNIACEIRNTFKLLHFQMKINPSNPVYSLWMAEILDALEICEFRVSDAAEKLGISTGQLVKILEKEPLLWQKTNQKRISRNLPPLKTH